MKKFFKLLVSVLMVVALATSSGCAIWNKTFKSDVKPEDVISAIQGVNTSIRWIEPIAGMVITVFFPQDINLYNAACKAADSAMLVSEDAIAAYQKNPNADTQKNLFSALVNVKSFWNALDAVYKNNPNATAQLKSVTSSV